MKPMPDAGIPQPPEQTLHTALMREAIALSLTGMRNNIGGPFGAVVVKDGEIVGRGCNQVLSSNDPTAHAEVVALRDAAQRLQTFELTGCVLYTSCEPCPMCLGAIYWARIDRLYYANTRHDASAAGFDDAAIYEQLRLPIEAQAIPTQRLLAEEAWTAFAEWQSKADKTPY